MTAEETNLLHDWICAEEEDICHRCKNFLGDYNADPHCLVYAFGNKCWMSGAGKYAVKSEFVEKEVEKREKDIAEGRLRPWP